MMAKVRYEVHYGTNQSGTYDITVDASEVPEDQDWLHLFYKYVPPEIAKAAYAVQWLGCQFM